MPLDPKLVIGKGLTFNKMTHLGLRAGYDLNYFLTDHSLTAELCLGDEDNSVPITGTTPFTRQPAVLDAIDQLGEWAQDIDVWMVAKKSDGTVVARTHSTAFRTHVKPFYGSLKISDIANDDPKMTYPGNGYGRVLSQKINDRYYFQLGGKLETEPTMRGFDCTTFPLALFSLTLPPPGYGKQLCDAAGAQICGLEQIHSADLQKKFDDNSIPGGVYILFSAGHVLLYHGYLNVLYEFNYGGFRVTSAPFRGVKGAPQDLWWMRKLPESYLGYFW